jgi:hypothetical protein
VIREAGKGDTTTLGKTLKTAEDYLRWQDNGASRDAVCARRALLKFGCQEPFWRENTF